MNQDQIMSGVRSLLKVIGAVLVARGATNAATIVNGEDVAGVSLVAVGMVWSWWQHRKDSTAK